MSNRRISLVVWLELILFAAGGPSPALALQTGASASQAENNEGTKLDGEVRYYEPGMKIAISIRPQVEKTFDLSSKDTGYFLDPGIQVGSEVECEEKKDENGRKLVIIRLKHKL